MVHKVSAFLFRYVWQSRRVVLLPVTSLILTNDHGSMSTSP